MTPPDPNRRTFLKTMGAGAAALSVTGNAAAQQRFRSTPAAPAPEILWRERQDGKHSFFLDPLKGERPFPNEPLFGRCLAPLARGVGEYRFAAGRTELTPAHPLVAGCCYDFTWTYFPEEQALPPGAVVAFSIPRSWTQPQIEGPGAGFVSVSRSGGGKCSVRLTHNANMTWWIVVTIAEKPEPPDGWIRADYDQVSVKLRVPVPEGVDHFPIIVSNRKDLLRGKTAATVLEVGGDTLNVYFGDVHAKTMLSDGLKTPMGFFEHARDVALIDFAAGDNHNGTPGLSARPSRFTNIPYRGGPAAVLAPELTRKAVFDAMYQRRCYATTGARIYLDFRLDERLMGSGLRVARGSKLPYGVVISGTDRIASIEFIQSKREGTVWTYDGKGFVRLHGELLFDESSWTYVRVTQTDRQVAWSSPIWVDVT